MATLTEIKLDIDQAAKRAGLSVVIGAHWTSCGDVTVKHPVGADLSAAHTAARALPHCLIVETRRSWDGSVVSLGRLS